LEVLPLLAVFFGTITSSHNSCSVATIATIINHHHNNNHHHVPSSSQHQQLQQGQDSNLFGTSISDLRRL
jgi:hypothetical protein